MQRKSKKVNTKLLALVTKHFDGDERKAVRWFEIENPLLGGLSPNDFIRLGRIDKLEKFILNQLAANQK